MVFHWSWTLEDGTITFGTGPPPDGPGIKNVADSWDELVTGSCFCLTDEQYVAFVAAYRQFTDGGPVTVRIPMLAPPAGSPAGTVCQQLRVVPRRTRRKRRGKSKSIDNLFVVRLG